MLGMMLFLASELMFFGGLFAAYFTLRSTAPNWPPADVELDLVLTSVATALLLLSSFSMRAGVVRVRDVDDVAGARLRIAVTFALGATFLAIKGYELSTAGFGVSSHAYGSLFFTILGAHGVHLLVGMGLLIAVAARPVATRLEPVGAYWHFVDVVWLAIFGAVYLIR